MRQIMVAGNWKMNGSTAMAADLVPALVSAVSKSGASANAKAVVDVVVCPPAVYLHSVGQHLAASSDAGSGVVSKGVSLGAQNVSDQSDGAFTGELSAAMLIDMGCQYVIVGHSERRSLYGESDDVVGAKAKAALAADLTPIICLGETLDERESGQTEAVVGRQLNVVAQVIGATGLARSVVAYEPVWAIGTGKTASGEQAQQVHAFLRQTLDTVDTQMAQTTRILYGGSVKGDNAEGLFAQPDIDGGLIGGASLKAQDFLSIVDAGTVTSA